MLLILYPGLTLNPGSLLTCLNPGLTFLFAFLPHLMILKLLKHLIIVRTSVQMQGHVADISSAFMKLSNETKCF